jgi:hypothetical protein
MVIRAGRCGEYFPEPIGNGCAKREYGINVLFLLLFIYFIFGLHDPTAANCRVSLAPVRQFLPILFPEKL